MIWLHSHNVAVAMQTCQVSSIILASQTFSANSRFSTHYNTTHTFYFLLISFHFQQKTFWPGAISELKNTTGGWGSVHDPTGQLIAIRYTAYSWIFSRKKDKIWDRTGEKVEQKTGRGWTGERGKSFSRIFFQNLARLAIRDLSRLDFGGECPQSLNPPPKIFGQNYIFFTMYYLLLIFFFL